MRPSTLLFHVTQRLLYTKWRDPGEEPKLHLFGQLKRITKQWLDTCLVCKGGTYPAQLMYQELADMACERITAGITRAFVGERPDQGRARSLQPHRLHRPRQLQHVEDGPLGDRRPPLPHQLGHPRQRLGGRVLPRGRVASAGPGLRQEPQPRPGSALPLRLRDAQVPARLHRAGGRRPRRRRPAAPHRRDQGLPPRGRQGEEIHDGDLLGARREQPRHLRPLGLRRVHRGLSDRGRLRGQGRRRVQQDDRVRHCAAGDARKAKHGQEDNQDKKTVETLKHDEATRKNIPTAEYQSVLQKEEQKPRSASPTSAATATSTRSSSGAARTSRTGATSSSTPRRSTSRRRSTPRC